MPSYKVAGSGTMVRRSDGQLQFLGGGAALPGDVTGAQLAEMIANGRVFDELDAAFDPTPTPDGGSTFSTAQQATLTGAYTSKGNAATQRWLRRRHENFQRDNLLPGKYYVDSVGGLDTNDGLTPATAWQTLTKVASSATLTAGDRVLLKRGSTFRTAFTVPGTGGSASAPIVFGSYGVGKLPVIKGSTALVATWTLDAGSVYKATTAVNPASGSAVFIDDDSVLTKAADRASMTAGTFFSDGTTMYLWLADSTSPTGKLVEYTNLGSLLTCGVPHVVFQDISWKHWKSNNAAVLFNATAASSVGMSVKRCDIGPGLGGALLIGCIGGVVEDNYVHDAWSLVDYPSASESGAVAFTTNTDGTEFRYNVVVGGYKGIRGINAHANVRIHHNIVIRPKVNGIDLTGGTTGKPSYVYNNFVWHRTSTGNGHGVDIQAGTAGTLFDFRNNIVYCDDTFASPPNLELYTVDATTYGGASSYIDYNLGYRTPGCTAAYGKVGSTSYPTFAAYKTALAGTSYSGQEAHSIEADPLLTNVTWPGGDFTPQPGSPCINAGVAIGAALDAYLGIPDYLGTAPDIGPFEVA